MIFQDRNEAGSKLAAALDQYKDDPDAVVIGLPRGGVVLAALIAEELNLPLDVICPRKIGAPFNKELAIGAITETGELIGDRALFEELGVSEAYLNDEIEYEKDQALRRLTLFRKGRPPRNLEDKTVIFVDDGLATGMTMKAAILTAREEGVAKIVVAVPVAPKETAEGMKELADEVVCLLKPPFFQGVGQFYRDFAQVEDDEVVELMKRHDNK